MPQGSILGPLFFLIYINDISNSSDCLNFITYADDTTLLANINSNSNDINTELSKVHFWFTTNKLSLNASKTKAITFHTSKRNITPPILSINNQLIENTDQTNFLGILLDKNLSFKPHINKISTKISKICGVMNKLKHTIPKTILKLIYQSLCVPHLTYGILAWGKCLHLSPIIKLQKRAVRTISNAKYNSHTDPLFSNLKLLKLEDLRKLFELKFFYKWKMGDLPSYFSSFLDPGRMDHRLRVPIHRHQFVKQGLRYSITSTINNFLELIIILNISSTHSLKAFSRRIESYIINQYPLLCTIPNCYICSR